MREEEWQFDQEKLDLVNKALSFQDSEEDEESEQMPNRVWDSEEEDNQREQTISTDKKNKKQTCSAARVDNSHLDMDSSVPVKLCEICKKRKAIRKFCLGCRSASRRNIYKRYDNGTRKTKRNKA